MDFVRLAEQAVLRDHARLLVADVLLAWGNGEKGIRAFDFAEAGRAAKGILSAREEFLSEMHFLGQDLGWRRSFAEGCPVCKNDTCVAAVPVLNIPQMMGQLSSIFYKFGFHL